VAIARVREVFTSNPATFCGRGVLRQIFGWLEGWEGEGLIHMSASQNLNIVRKLLAHNQD